MAITEEEFQELKQEHDSAKGEAERAKGALDAQMSRLKQEFGCKSLAEAESLLKKLRKERDETETAAEKAIKEYRAKWNTPLT